VIFRLITKITTRSTFSRDPNIIFKKGKVSGIGSR